MLNVANYSFDEILDEANKAPNPTEALTGYIREKSYVKEWLEVATNNVWPSEGVEVSELTWDRRFDTDKILPDGTIRLLSKQSKVFYDGVILSKKIPAKMILQKTGRFMEGLHPKEAAVFHSVLKKDLFTLYPNLTHTVISEALNNVR